MTVSTRITAPNYKIYEPDALDAIFAKASLDPIMGGIAGAMGNAHRMESMTSQGDYLASQDKFNKTAANLDAMEIAQKQKGEILKAATALLGHGAATTDLEPGALAGLYTGQGYRNDTLGNSLRDKMAAEAQHARSGGGGGEKEETSVATVNADGGVTTVKRKGAYGQTGGIVPPEPNREGSTPTKPQNRDAAKVMAKQALTILGPQAVPQAGPAGTSTWTSPTKPGVILKFDANGNMSRGP